ncbi:hypothetical protein AAG906_007885 [Vitis piasezkii]
MANSRRRRNFLEKLRINRALLEGENNIKEGGQMLWRKWALAPSDWIGLDGVSQRQGKSRVLELGVFVVSTLPSGYLGLPLGVPYKTNRIWEGVEERVAARLEKIQRDFLWEGGGLVNKPHLVKRSIFCMEKQKGGLGFRSLPLFNKALLGKWSWRFVKERDTLWKLVIIGKYGVKGRFGLGVWKAIRNEWNVFKANTRLKVGSGIGMKF